MFNEKNVDCANVLVVLCQHKFECREVHRFGTRTITYDLYHTGYPFRPIESARGSIRDTHDCTVSVGWDSDRLMQLPSADTHSKIFDNTATTRQYISS